MLAILDDELSAEGSGEEACRRAIDRIGRLDQTFFYRYGPYSPPATYPAPGKRALFCCQSQIVAQPLQAGGLAGELLAIDLKPNNLLMSIQLTRLRCRAAEQAAHTCFTLTSLPPAAALPAA